MSRNYDNWERLVRAVRRREKDRQLASCPSFSSFSSVDVSSRPSFADPAVLSSLSISVSGKITAIGLEEIKLATQNFHPDTLLGEGRFGPIFKGWIHENLLTAVKPGSGIAVAIRKLNNGEAFCLNLPRHPNLVKLIGYSSEEGNRFLVYEFVPNGSLDNHLFTRGHQLLSWETRVKVGIGAARGLSFCHDFGMTVTNKGVKSSNILLDDVFSAKLSEFDLTTTRSSYLENDYAAPEYRATGFPTMESDVYSFGILLLELFSGLRVCDKNRSAEEQNLVVWAKPYLRNKKKLLQIVDSRFKGQFPHDEAYKIWKLAFQCLSLNPKLRPRMTDVLDTLEQLSSPLSDGPLYRRNLAELITGIDRQKALAGWINSSFLNEDFVLAFGRASKSFSLPRAVSLNFKEIQKATANFRSDLLLEEGSSVFKGVFHDLSSTHQKLESIILVAVKKFNKEELVRRQECLAEINYWRKLCHPNLVDVIGYCFEADNRILVYEFVSRGSLSNHLSSRGLRLSWIIRLKVAYGVAEALAFLHGKKRYLHRGFDSGDILLDGAYDAKLSYCCLPRVASARSPQLAYESPESLATGQLTEKSDVYCFGVVLLELLSGRRAYDINRPTGQQNLVQWATPYLGSKILGIMDSRLEGQYSDEVYQVAQVAFKCLSIDPGSRPTMADVVMVFS